jgi:hypothetical protein
MLNTVKFGLVAPSSQKSSSVASKPMVPAFRGGLEKVVVQNADAFVTKAAVELGQIKLVERARQALVAGESDRASLLYKIALPKVLKKFENEAEKIALYMTEMSQACFNGANTLFENSVKAAGVSVKIAGKAVNESGDDAVKAGSKSIKELAEKNAEKINNSILATPNAQQKFTEQVATHAIEANEIAQLKMERQAKAVKAQVEALENQMKLEQLQHLQEMAMQPVKEKAELGFKI